MAANQFKQSLWFMREILQSSPYGITREELCSKWAVSSMNDYPGEEISERTFHRIRRLLEDAFQVKIECSKDGNKRYRLSAEDLTPGRPSLLDLVLMRTDVKDADKSSTLNEVASLLTTGRELSTDDKDALSNLTLQLRRIPFDYGTRLIADVESGAIEGAMYAEWDMDYKYYVSIWDEDTFQRTRQWLSVGLCPEGIFFYIVSDEQDYDLREGRAAEVGADEGVRYRRGFWWHEMRDKSLFTMPASIVPDYDEIVKRCKLILSRINNVKA